MAVTVASLRAVLDLDKKGFDSGLKSSKSSLSGFLGSFGTVAAVAGAAAVGIGIATSAISGLVSASKEWIDLARIQQAAEKELEQVIRANGGAAGVTADEMKKLASSLQSVTNFGDEAIIKGESLLLTFTNIGKDVMPQAVETMLDMSQVMGQDLKSSAIQLGKALNDPVKGIGALTRIGVSFTEQQQKMIKEMVKAGDIMGAQKVIMDAIASQGFGGQARALADPLIQLNNLVGDLKESLGFALLPIINSLASAALPALGAIIDAIAPGLKALGESAAATLAPALKELGQSVVEWVGAVSEFGTQAVALAKSLGLINQDATAGSILFGVFADSIRGVALIFKFSMTIYQSIAKVLEVMTALIGGVKAGWEGFSFAARTVTSDLQAARATWDTLVRGFQIAWEWLKKLTAQWVQFAGTLSQGISIPDWLTPGSPTPLELGLRGIRSELSRMPDLSRTFGGGTMAMAGAAAGGGNTTIVNLGGQQMTFTGPDQDNQAIGAVVKQLRASLKAGKRR